MIWIIGGTSEARELVKRIGDLDKFVVTVATEEGKQFIDSDKLITGRMNLEEMGEFVEDRSIKLIVDLTHPFAKIVSDNARKVASLKEIGYLRYVRETIEEDKDLIYLKSYEEAYEYLAQVQGTVFFTTGSKNIGDFERVRGDNRFIYRILPAMESIRIAEDNSVSIRDLVAVLGPFSKEYNKVMFQEYGADYCVSKDSGVKGGTLEKIEAAKELGLKTIIIGRYQEEGVSSLEQVEEIIRKVYREEN